MPQTAYPIAASAHDALNHLRAGSTVRALREREAETLAGAEVCFVSENVGPVYERETDALEACAGLLGDGACRLVCRMRDGPRRGAKPLEPVFKDGERWPKLKRPLVSVWQLSISYWKILGVERKSAGTVPAKPARALRRKGGEGLTPEEVMALMDAPMTAARPQKALDFGLFDFPLPENPDIVIADE